MMAKTGRPKALILYDCDDADGFFAGYAAYLAYGEQADYVGLHRGDLGAGVSGGKDLVSAIDGRDVVILDIAVSPAQLQQITKRATSLLVIDHHDSSRSACAQYPEYSIFDPTHSACILAWQRFHETKPVPRLFEYVEDRDLWKWQLPHSREISAAIRSYPWDWKHAAMMVASLGQLQYEGVAILRRIATECANIVARVERPARLWGFEMPVVNATSFISEVHEKVAEKFPRAPFTATFDVLYSGDWKWELRSRGEFDVGALATLLGGGGHKHAAGFIAPSDDPYMKESAEAVLEEFGPKNKDSGKQAEGIPEKSLEAHGLN